MVGDLRHLLAGILILAAAPAVARAGEALKYAPAADWVRPMAPGEAVYNDVRADHAVLGRSLQIHLRDGGSDDYVETFVRLQTPSGLRVGRPTVTWDPADETVTINKLEIIRGGQVIDLLARGQSFFVMRRETQLDDDILTGDLTAMIEPEGLQVGDVLDFAYTRNLSVPEMGTYAANVVGISNAAASGKTELRFLWDNARPMQWHLTPDMPVPNLVHGADSTELDLDLTGYMAPPEQADLPDRDTEVASVQLSQFPSWQKVSATMAPFFDRAATLTVDSPLRAEIDRIRASSNDPKVRAAEALHLVESAIAYAAVPGREDGQIPPAADVTWVRRWGDCKAKTALLTALLRALDIDATPSLVDTDDGDGIGEKLPSLGLFDHVIVRSVIGGNTYWLDATHDVDGTLDQLAPAAEKWALPLTVAGETLQPIVVAPYDLPTLEHHIELDASAGLEVPAKVRLEIVHRGSRAFTDNLKYSALMPEALDDQLRKDWLKNGYEWLDIDSAEMHFDADAGEIHYIFQGHADMYWQPHAAGASAAYEADVMRLITLVKPPARVAGLYADAPVALNYPLYIRDTETIRLPNDGQGYGLVGGAVDTKIIGLQLHRAVSLKDGVVSIEASKRSLVPEVPIAEIQAAAATLSSLHDQVYVTAPGHALPTAEADASPAVAGAPLPAATLTGSRGAIDGSDAAAVVSSVPAAKPAPASASMLDRLAALYGGGVVDKTVH